MSMKKIKLFLKMFKKYFNLQQNTNIQEVLVIDQVNQNKMW